MSQRGEEFSSNAEAEYRTRIDFCPPNPAVFCRCEPECGVYLGGEEFLYENEDAVEIDGVYYSRRCIANLPQFQGRG